MPITGKIVHIGQVVSGTRKRDGQPWKKQEFVLETGGQYPKKVAFSIMNDKIDKANIQLGHSVEIEVDASSREYNGKWYTELAAWKVNNLGVVNTPAHTQPVYQQQAPQGYQQQQAQPQTAPNSQSSSDLPF